MRVCALDELRHDVRKTSNKFFEFLEALGNPHDAAVITASGDLHPAASNMAAQRKITFMLIMYVPSSTSGFSAITNNKIMHDDMYFSSRH